jgi:hypothetical protein
MRKTILILVTLLFSFDIYSQQIDIKLNEGFESSIFPPSGWRRINLNGANQWQRLTVPLPPEIMQLPVQGTSIARINYEYSGGEDWLITKKIYSITAGDTLMFFLIKQSDQGPFPPDSLIVKISTTDSLQSSFTNTLININIAGIPTGNQSWHKYCLPLSQFTGQNIFIAFQHEDLNGHGCALDSIVVFNSNSIGINKNGDEIPGKPELFQNYPNPFNPSTNIKFQIPCHSGSTTNNLPRQVTLKVFDVLGKEIITLINEKLDAGLYQVQFSGYQLPSGIYFYKLETGEYSVVKSMVMLK